ncbi:MAG: hypothetical protein MI924_36650, partial [Chloroflexales bacterium]|nr:hypothetical protein [Chloroflexales bacterium]
MRRRSGVLTLVVLVALLVPLWPVAPPARAAAAQVQLEPPMRTPLDRSLPGVSQPVPEPEPVPAITPRQEVLPTLALDLQVAPDPLTVGMDATVTITSR